MQTQRLSSIPRSFTTTKEVRRIAMFGMNMVKMVARHSGFLKRKSSRA